MDGGWIWLCYRVVRAVRGGAATTTPYPRKDLAVSSAETPEREAVEAAIRRHAHEPGPLLVVLHAVQDALGYIPPHTVPVVAEALNLSRAEVHGVVTFYHYFRTQKPGACVVQVCRAEACQARGGAMLESHVCATLGLEFHETSADGRTTLEPIFCMGNCATGPAVRINGRLHSHVTPERFDALLNTREQRP